MLRGEIIQNNKNVGFENFSLYNGRKRNFMTTRKDTEQMVKHAVISSFEHGNLNSLEIRINPGNTYIENAKLIEYYDRIIAKDQRAGKRLDEKEFYYVFHFSKQKEKSKINLEVLPIPCRNAELRKKVQIQGFAIIELRNRIPEKARRIHGIDACAMETGCRPEVFGPVFRRLKHHVVSFSDKENAKQLRLTYHAGEDFLDMVDGIRALDEAMKFLCMGHGDRFGHATVLGLSVDDWYKRKNNRIQIGAQDYLDNIVWLYQKILEFGLKEFEGLKDFLLHEFQELFHRIYSACLPENFQATIFDYYDAWKLRGDKPELYCDGKYKKGSSLSKAETPENPVYPEDPKIRLRHETAYLYYAYHYLKDVRIRGEASVEKLISQEYIKAVKCVQTEIKREIARKGIGIETNPTSNLFISTMEDYDEHPIINLYNRGLNNKIGDRSTQLYVSVNTDDKGVFHTSLENEYALMASALENMKDEDGKFIFSPQEVYDWVDKIRVMGNQQVF